MNQALHIFRKDSRQHWPEILFSLVITAGFFAFFPSQWRVVDDLAARNHIGNVVSILVMLMIVSWWLLTSRVVFAENLVGDCQFWITRPYRWPSLLASKALFLVVWIALPLVVGQLALLASAGFHPIAKLPGAALIVLLVCDVFVLTVFAVAAVTSNLGKLTLTVLIVFVVGLLFSNWINFFRTGYVPYLPQSNPFVYPLLLAGCVSALILVYATRRVWLTRIVLLIIPLLLSGTEVLYHSQVLANQTYPAAAPGSTAPMILTHTPTNRFPDKARTWHGKYYIDLPVSYSRVPQGNVVFMDNFRFTLTSSSGGTWTSPWQRLGRPALPSDSSTIVSLMLDPAIFNRFRSEPVDLSIDFGVSHFQSDSISTIGYPGSDTAIPNVGFCQPQASPLSGLLCRTTQQPRLTYATVVWSSAPCSDSPTVGNTAPGDGWLGTNTTDLRMTLVETSLLWFRNQRGSGRGWHICPGSPLVLTQYHLVDRTRLTLSIPGFQFPANVIHTDPGDASQMDAGS